MVSPQITKRAGRVLKAVALKRQAWLYVAYKMYPDALALLKEASPLFESIQDKAECAKQITYCKKRICGIDDWRDFGIGIWYGTERISSGVMHDLLGTKRSSSVRSGVVQRRRGGITIRQVMFGLLDEYTEDDVTLDMALPKVLEAYPNSKFNEAHLKYYKSKYRNRKETSSEKD